tara:strand:+ start:208 stop:333 length:126 start_codon:yes stop_codon:yes gene_type:complete
MGFDSPDHSFESDHQDIDQDLSKLNQRLDEEKQYTDRLMKQ